MIDEKSYVLVTPARDEEATIERTIESILQQTILPLEWVIVSDGSTDRTDEIVELASANHPWIRLLRITHRPGKSFAAVVHNTLSGLQYLHEKQTPFLGLLDADVVFQKDYFEILIERFSNNLSIGLAGGVVIDVGMPRNRFPRNKIDVPGAVQFYRRTCFEAMGGLIPIPEGGWDGMACAMARMHGFQTRLFTDLVVDHLKPRNISQGGAIRRKWQMGVRDYAAGYHPVFEMIKCASRLKNSPLIIGSLAWFIGYLTAWLSGKNRIISPDLQTYIRGEQRHRVLRMISWNRQWKDPV